MSATNMSTEIVEAFKPLTICQKRKVLMAVSGAKNFRKWSFLISFVLSAIMLSFGYDAANPLSVFSFIIGFYHIFFMIQFAILLWFMGKLRADNVMYDFSLINNYLLCPVNMLLWLGVFLCMADKCFRKIAFRCCSCYTILTILFSLLLQTFVKCASISHGHLGFINIRSVRMI